MRPLIASAAGLAAALGAVIPAAASDRASDLVRQWRSADDACGDPRGSATAIASACGRQKQIAARLQRVDWCLGRDGELSHRYTRHRCAVGSYNADGSSYAVKVVGALR